MKKARLNLTMLILIFALLSCSVMSVLVFAETPSGEGESQTTGQDFTWIASEDPATSDITGATQDKPNVNNIETTYIFDQIQQNGKDDGSGNITGGYLNDIYGYSTCKPFEKSLSAVVLKLGNAIVASDYDTLSLTAYYGATGDFCLFPSTAKRFTSETAVGKLSVTVPYKDIAITAKTADLAKEDGKIYDITLGLVNMKTKGQIFFKNIVLKTADGTETVINFLDRNDVIVPYVGNINEVDPVTYEFDTLIKQTWSGAGMGLNTNHRWLKAGMATAILFKTPIDSRLYETMDFTLYSGLKGTIDVYPLNTMTFSEESKITSKMMVQYSKNTFELTVADFAEDDYMVRGFILFLPETLSEDPANQTAGQLFVGELRAKAVLEPDLDPKDFTWIATEDPTTSPITGPVQGEEFNVNNVKKGYTFLKLVENPVNGYKGDTYGYATPTITDPLSAVVIGLKDPILAENYTKVTLNAYFGATGEFSIYPSTAKRFVRSTAILKVDIPTQYKEYAMTLNSADLAKEDGKIYDITLSAEKIVDGGQIFLKNLVLTKEDGTEDIINFLDRNNIISADGKNVNEVNLAAYIFDGLAPQTYADAGMGLNTRTAWIDEGTAVVIKFKRPISAEQYDKMEFTIYSGLKGTLEIYPASAKSFVASNAVASKEMTQYTRNKFKIYLDKLADEDGMVRNMTFYLPEQLSKEGGAKYTAGQLFFGEAKVSVRTETSYLDELVLTEGASKSMTVEGAGEFITENIPEATGSTGAIDPAFALKLTGKTTLNFKKVINQQEGQFGNIHMRMYMPDGSAITKLNFAKVGDETQLHEIDVTGKKGWFEVVLPIMDYLNEEGNIGSIVVSMDKEGEVLFGGAEVEDKLRILDKKTSSVDISEVLPLSEEGFTYKVTEKVDYIPMFENSDMSANVVKFKLKVSDLSDFNVMFNLSGAGKKTNGIWFWFDKHGVNMIGGQRTNYPQETQANQWMEIEIGAVPYTVNFMPYGVKGYLKINGRLILEGNVDSSVQPTGKWFGCYVHQTKADTEISVAPVEYHETEVLSLSTSSGESTLNIGETDKIIVKRNVVLEGQEISKIEVLSGDSITVDELGFIEAVKQGTTVFKVTTSAVGVIPAKEYTISIEANKYYTVKVGSKSVQVKEGEKLVLPELNPPKEGYVFAGLFTDKECTNKFDYENTSITKDMVLYVGWMLPEEDSGSTGCGCGASMTTIPFMVISAAVAMFSFAMLRKKREDK